MPVSKEPEAEEAPGVAAESEQVRERKRDKVRERESVISLQPFERYHTLCFQCRLTVL